MVSFWLFFSYSMVAPPSNKATKIAETKSKTKESFFYIAMFLAFSVTKRSLITSLALHPIFYTTASSS